MNEILKEFLRLKMLEIRAFFYDLLGTLLALILVLLMALAIAAIIYFVLVFVLSNNVAFLIFLFLIISFFVIFLLYTFVKWIRSNWKQAIINVERNRYIKGCL